MAHALQLFYISLQNQSHYDNNPLRYQAIQIALTQCLPELAYFGNYFSADSHCHRFAPVRELIQYNSPQQH